MYPDRCYCRVTRQYLSEALRSEFSDGRRLERFSIKKVFTTYDPATQTYKHSETIELDLHSFLDPIQARVAECKDRSRAILAYNQSNAENSCFQDGAPAPGATASKLAETLAQVLATVPKHQLDQRPGAKTVLATRAQVGSHGGQILEVRKRSDSAAWRDDSDFPDL